MKVCGTGKGAQGIYRVTHTIFIHLFDRYTKFTIYNLPFTTNLKVCRRNELSTVIRIVMIITRYEYNDSVYRVVQVINSGLKFAFPNKNCRQVVSCGCGYGYASGYLRNDEG